GIDVLPAFPATDDTHAEGGARATAGSGGRGADSGGGGASEGEGGARAGGAARGGPYGITAPVDVAEPGRRGRAVPGRCRRDPRCGCGLAVHVRGGRRAA